MSRQPEYSELMTPENARIFKTAWDRAASSYDLTPERVAAEMKSQIALSNLESMGLGPKATTGHPDLDHLLRTGGATTGHKDLDLKLMGVRDTHPLDDDGDGNVDWDEISEVTMKITRRQLRQLIKEEISLLKENPDITVADIDKAEKHLENARDALSGRTLTTSDWGRAGREYGNATEILIGATQTSSGIENGDSVEDALEDIAEMERLAADKRRDLQRYQPRR